MTSQDNRWRQQRQLCGAARRLSWAVSTVIVTMSTLQSAAMGHTHGDCEPTASPEVWHICVLLGVRVLQQHGFQKH